MRLPEHFVVEFKTNRAKPLPGIRDLYLNVGMVGVDLGWVNYDTEHQFIVGAPLKGYTSSPQGYSFEWNFETVGVDLRVRTITEMGYVLFHGFNYGRKAKNWRDLPAAIKSRVGLKDVKPRNRIIVAMLG